MVRGTVPRQANHEEYRQEKGLVMHGQMTVGPGSPSPRRAILQSHCEMLGAVVGKLREENRLQEPTLAGALIVTGCGGMGGAQPLPQKS